MTALPGDHRNASQNPKGVNDSNLDDEAKMRLSSQPKFKVMDSMNVWNMREATST